MKYMEKLREDWRSLAACREGDPDQMFAQNGVAQNIAKRVCQSCLVRPECLAEALDNRIEFGIWGGMTKRERRQVLRRHPNVESWRKIFEAAMRSREASSPEVIATNPAATVNGSALEMAAARPASSEGEVG